MRVDARIEQLARRQNRIVTLDDLRGLGLSRDAIAHRVKRDRLQRLWTRTYLVGAQPPDPLALATGAVASYGGDAALDHRWGAWLWGFAEIPSVPVAVAVLRGTRVHRPRIRARSGYRLDACDVTRRRNIPVLTPAATCLSLAATELHHELERMVAQAQVIGVLRESHLRDVIARHRGRCGVPALATLIEEGPRFTRAESERVMLAVLREADLPPPETNVRILDYEVDFLWRGPKLVVEVDGYSTHGNRRAFEYDRHRRQVLAAAGYQVIPVTWRQLHDRPVAVAMRIGEALVRAEQR